MGVRVKYIDSDLAKMGGLSQIEKGNWIDVRACKVEVNGELKVLDTYDRVSYNQGDVVKVYLGFAMELPKGYEALVCPRSSTFKNYGLIQTNGVGVIDNSFKGNGDEWAIMFYALRGGCIEKLERIGQFRAIESMPTIHFIEVEDLGNIDRGAYGSTGVK